MNLQGQLYSYLKAGQKSRHKLVSESASKKRSSSLTSEENRFLSLPPYALLRQPKLMPPGTWALHCSRNQFRKFRKGSKLKNLHLSTYVSPITAPTDNLHLSLDQAVFSFAYDPKDPNILEACTRYGLDAYLFQTDQAVKIYHTGDAEPQLIFPTRSEYNMHRVLSDGGEGLSVEVAGEFYYFENVQELIQNLKEAEA